METQAMTTEDVHRGTFHCKVCNMEDLQWLLNVILKT